MSTLIAVMTGSPQPTTAKAGMTGHFKKPVKSAEITAEGLVGDSIMDREHHGGVDQAVYLFGEPDQAWWAEELDREVGPGYFGENLLISDMESSQVCVGDQYQIGDVLLEITSPRIPCATYAAHIGSGQAIKQFYAAQRPGAYGRVLQTGTVAPGMSVTHTPYTGIRIPVVEMMDQYLRRYDDEVFLKRILHTPAHHKMHHNARERLGKT